jgi:lipopolysaccharide export system ATP-binding protein
MSLTARGLCAVLAGRVVIDGAELDVPAGRLVGLTGGNGAGKSTLLRLMAGDLEPSAGTVTLGSVDVTTWPLHRRARAGLGYVSQGPSVIPELTVRANVALGGLDRDRVDAVLGEASLETLADRRAGALSTGERRRVELARAIARAVVALVVDEPMAGLDGPGQRWVERALRRVAASGAAVLLADPHAESMHGWVDAIHQVAAGRVAATSLRHETCGITGHPDG